MAGVQVFILTLGMLTGYVLAFVKCEFPPLSDVSLSTWLEASIFAAQRASSEGCSLLAKKRCFHSARCLPPQQRPDNNQKHSPTIFLIHSSHC